jgi:hypothetical protein
LPQRKMVNGPSSGSFGILVRLEEAIGDSMVSYGSNGNLEEI